MTSFDILIIGAGAAGLMAASLLAKGGRTVVVLEARSRIGGRICTHRPKGFLHPLEAGAEFIHGRLPVTLSAVQKAGIRPRPVAGKVWKINNGIKSETDEFPEGWNTLLQKLQELQTDMPIAEFLNRHFSGAQHQPLRQSVLQFVQGYDAADAAQASAFALRDEWLHEDQENDLRVAGGYGQLMQFLLHDMEQAGGLLQPGAVVTEVHWQQGQVTCQMQDGRTVTARQALITVPLGVWQQDQNAEGALTFYPDLPEKRAAARQMGFGAVVKLHLQFTEEFWQSVFCKHFPGASFLLSDAPIPTWWTQWPQPQPVLTGWLAGPQAAALKDVPDEALRQTALESLACILNSSATAVAAACTAFSVKNWTADPFSRGAYSYATLHTKTALPVLAQPVADTLFFAGEALYTGVERGTVEAALASGKSAAQQLLSGG